MPVTTLTFDVREFLDGAALAGVHVGAQAILRTEEKLDLNDVVEDGPNRPGSRTGAGSTPGPSVSARIAEPINAVDAEAAEAKWGVTDADGMVTFTWDEATATAYAAGLTKLRTDHPGVPIFVVFDGGFRLTAPTARLRQLANMSLIRLDGRIPVGTALRRTFRADLAATVVGHVTDTSARLWFSLAPKVGRLTASYELRRAGDRVPVSPVRKRLSFSGDEPPTATLDLSGLTAGTDYEYDLFVSSSTDTWRATRGWFRTVDPSATSWRFAFASCSQPRGYMETERWRALDGWAPDCTFLLGDQVYGDFFRDGKPIGPPDAPTVGWEEWYASRYRSSWFSPHVRNALRRRATYMMLDDHDVADDWGTTFTTVDVAQQPRIVPALAAYDRFQHSHNPPTPGRQFDDARDYTINRGAVCVFVLDERTRRGIEPSPDGVLGSAQWTRLRTWAASPEVAAADVLLVVSPVPLAFCDVELATDVIKAGNWVADASSFLTDPVSAVSDAFWGWSLSDWVDGKLRTDVEYDRGRMVEPDMADQWAHTDHQAELGRLLDLLFDLQNDPARQRLVVVLSGDSHLGSVHTITSKVAAAGANDRILQVTSSPIGRGDEADLVTQLKRSDKYFGSFILVPRASGSYDEMIAGRYRGDIDATVDRRNFGSLVLRRQPGTGRVYEVRAALHAAPDGQSAGFEERVDVVVDLDSPGRPTPLPFAARTPVRRARG